MSLFFHALQEFLVVDSAVLVYVHVVDDGVDWFVLVWFDAALLYDALEFLLWDWTVLVGVKVVENVFQVLFVVQVRVL